MWPSASGDAAQPRDEGVAGHKERAKKRPRGPKDDGDARGAPKGSKPPADSDAQLDPLQRTLRDFTRVMPRGSVADAVTRSEPPLWAPKVPPSWQTPQEVDEIIECMDDVFAGKEEKPPNEAASSAASPRGEMPETPRDNLEQDLETLLGNLTPDNAAKTAEESLKRMWSEASQPLAAAPPDQKELDLKIAMAEGFHLRESWIGQKWEREKKASAELRQGYLACVTTEQKRDFRQKWCARKLELLEQHRVHTRAYARVDKSLGTYMCFGKLIEEYGVMWDRSRAVVAAWKYASKCLAMGGDWVFRDTMSEEMMFLHLRKGVDHVLEEKWKLRECESSAKGSGGVRESKEEGDDCAGASHRRRTPTKAAKDGGGETPSGKKAPSGGDGERKVDEREKEFSRLLADAFKLKGTLQSSLGLCDALKSKVEAGGPWEWAQDSKVVSSMLAAQQALLAAMGEFGATMMVSTPKDVTSQGNRDVLIVGLRAFLATTAEKGQLDSACKRLQRMHAEALKA